MRAKNRKYKFLYILLLLNREKTSVGCLPYTVSKHVSSLYMLTWQIFDIFSKSAVDPKYCLLAVDLFTSKTYVYPMKSRNLLARKLKHFYRDIQPKIEQIAKNERMRLQTDSEFWQNEIQKLNQNYNIEMFRSRVRRGRAHAAKQKLENSKNFFFPKQTTA